jgi:hypothetical protein
MNHDRNLRLAAAAALLIAGGAGAAFAHPHPDGDGKTVERVFIVRDSGGGEHHGEAGHDPQVRRFVINGADVAGCEGGDKIVDDSGGEGDKKTKVIICTRGQPNAASAERLEEALARINDNDELSAEQKARITTAIQSAIDRARSAR